MNKKSYKEFHKDLKNFISKLQESEKKDFLNKDGLRKFFQSFVNTLPPLSDKDGFLFRQTIAHLVVQSVEIYYMSIDSIIKRCYDLAQLDFKEVEKEKGEKPEEIKKDEIDTYCESKRGPLHVRIVDSLAEDSGITIYALRLYIYYAKKCKHKEWGFYPKIYGICDVPDREVMKDLGWSLPTVQRNKRILNKLAGLNYLKNQLEVQE